VVFFSFVCALFNFATPCVEMNCGIAHWYCRLWSQERFDVR
jgi:hypothetical protein